MMKAVRSFITYFLEDNILRKFARTRVVLYSAQAITIWPYSARRREAGEETNSVLYYDYQRLPPVYK